MTTARPVGAALAGRAVPTASDSLARPQVVASLRGVAFAARGGAHLFGPLDLELRAGELAVVTGGAATGKSVLLDLAMGALAPTAGEILTLGERLAVLDDAGLGRLRCRIGHVAQRGALLSNLSLYDNLTLPLAYHTRLADAELLRRARVVLAELGVGVLPSGSAASASRALARQVALARSLILEPALLVLDEPTAGMDAALAAATWTRLRGLQHSRGLAILAAIGTPGAPTDHADHVIALGSPTVASSPDGVQQAATT